MACLCGCRAEEHDADGTCQTKVGKWKCPCIRFRQACQDEPRRPMQLPYEPWYVAADPETEFDKYCAQMMFLYRWPEGVPIARNLRLAAQEQSRRVN